MRKQHWLALGGVLAALGLGLGLTAPARSQLPRPQAGTLPKELAGTTQLDEKDIVKLLTALGPAVSQQLAAGRQVQFPGLGTFRVVRLLESKNLRDGRPVTEPARNIVEFLPDAALTQSANAPGAVPAAEVPPFQYNPLPDQTPGQKVPSGRTPSSRIR